MNTAHSFDMSLAITGSGGIGAITVGELLLRLAGKSGFFGLMRRSFGPQIRGGETAALLRISDQTVHCMNDSFDLLLALDWLNAERFAEEITLRPGGLIIADPSAGEVPLVYSEMGIEVLEIPMKALAGEVPGGRSNLIALGLLAHWLGFSGDTADKLIDSVFSLKGEEIVSGSRGAFNKGFSDDVIVKARKARQPSAPVKKRSQAGRWQLSGNEACGLGALRGGIRFAAAYPITPATELLEWLAPRLKTLGGGLLQAEDELASINMIIGGSFGGVPSMTATSGPGLSLMLEAMGLAVAAEVPATVVNVMRGGPSTGCPTKSEQTDLNVALYGLHGDAPHLVLGALDHADCILTTEWAVRLAEALQTLAVVLSDQYLAQSRVLLSRPNYELPAIPLRSLASEDENYQRYQLTESGISPMAIPGTALNMYVADGLEHTETGKPSSMAVDHQAQLDKRLRKITDFEFGELWADIRGQGTTAIVTWGSSSGAVREAAERLASGGEAVKVIAIRLLLPASPEKLAAELQDVKRVLVVEQSHSRQFYLYLRSFYDIAADTRVLARPGPLLITPGEIVKNIQEWS
ncbi:MAG: 2-oxoacid:acceptor oxidoreductase subunit alpha [Lysobacterales bacterium]